MASNRRDSIIINNFFTLASIIMVTAVLAVYSKYFGDKKEEIRVNSNLPCQQNIKTTDYITNPQAIKNINYFFDKGLYVLNGGFIKPRFGKFYLKDKITINQANELFIKAIKKTPIENPIKYLTIKYEIIENDKNDPRKKDFEKKYAGELLSSFRISGQEIFRMKTQFLEYNKASIEERINCTIKALKHNAN